ncbi:hypothetical protein KM043_008171 [Ampulex compressa]|nr:hypothetical protein KM043_008171 [Ampulex compressa]
MVGKNSEGDAPCMEVRAFIHCAIGKLREVFLLLRPAKKQPVYREALEQIRTSGGRPAGIPGDGGFRLGRSPDPVDNRLTAVAKTHPPPFPPSIPVTPNRPDLVTLPPRRARPFRRLD